MRLLITGGAGFIGANLIAQIIDQPEIETLVNLDCLTYAGSRENLESTASNPKYQFANVDVRDSAAVRDIFAEHAPTHVIHLAAESHVDRSIAAPATFVETNVVGTFNLIEAARVAWGNREHRRFLHVSTDEVYGSIPEGQWATETSPYAPNSPYAASKAASDFLVRAAQKTFGFPALKTHCSNNFGPLQFPEKFIPVVIQAALTGHPVPLYGDGAHVRDWIDVHDHVDALWTVLTRGKNGETYNIGARNEHPNCRVAELICDHVDTLADHPPGTSRKLISFVADRPGHDRRYGIDPSKIERELGWKAKQPFERALGETVAWYAKNQDWVKRMAARRDKTF